MRNNSLAHRPCLAVARVGKAREGGSRRPGTKSLWLLPSGPDQVGDSAVRRLPRGHMVRSAASRKFMSHGRPSLTRSRADERRTASNARHADARSLLDRRHAVSGLAADRSPFDADRRYRAPRGHRSSARWASRSAPIRPATTRSPLVLGRPTATVTAPHCRRDASRRRPLLRELDANHDGEIDPDEIAHYEYGGRAGNPGDDRELDAEARRTRAGGDAKRRRHGDGDRRRRAPRGIDGAQPGPRTERFRAPLDTACSTCPSRSPPPTPTSTAKSRATNSGRAAARVPAARQARDGRLMLAELECFRTRLE